MPLCTGYMRLDLGCGLLRAEGADSPTTKLSLNTGIPGSGSIPVLHMST